ncbi:MAG: DUF1367 family protein [Candidatus Scalindua sp.]|nr:DUF1367 family protein [Candidatus Scalindua sp.]
MKINLKKMDSVLIPDDEDTGDWINKLKYGQVISADFKKPRNYEFHKKYFALIKFAYENWSPSPIQGIRLEPKKNFEAFRESLTIGAGHYEVVFMINGEYKPKAKSISFAKMNEESFNEFYSETINVILDKVLTNYTKEDVDKVVEEVMRFY